MACGLAPGGSVVSAGDGVPRVAGWDALDRARLGHAASRLVGIEGLGYVVGGSHGPLPLPTDRALERDILRLAGVAEEALAPLEPVFSVLERLLAKLGWKRAAWCDILHVR